MTLATACPASGRVLRVCSTERGVIGPDEIPEDDGDASGVIGGVSITVGVTEGTAGVSKGSVAVEAAAADFSSVAQTRQ